jgi:molybdenum cofactor synthesis domain-containing protein
MRPFGQTITLAAARSIIDTAIHPIARVETVPLDAAHTRVLARPAVATRDVPPFSRAAMDGYAVRAEDTAGATSDTPITLRRVGTIYTGEVTDRALGPRECYEIATGAPMPPGADAVVIVEQTASHDAEAVQVFAPVASGQNIGQKASDIAAAQTVLEAGAVLTSSRLGALAAIGLAQVEVYARPRVAILSTGNEIVEPGDTLSPGALYDVNRFTVAAVVREHGGEPVFIRTANDTLADLSRALDECLAHDMLVFSGGSSVGERDLILDVIGDRGRVLFHGISVKPGKPTAFGLIDAKPVFGLPGYPTSCLTNAYVLLAPAVRKMAHLPPVLTRQVTLPLGGRVVSAPGRHQFYTVRIEDGVAMPAFKASGDITSMSLADGFIEIPIDVDVLDQGTPVTVTLF